MSESKAFHMYFGDLNGVGIIEILEYPYISDNACKYKKVACEKQNLMIAIDDFGVGLSDMDLVDMYSPQIVKIDRSLISDIDTRPDKQENVFELVQKFHNRDIMVVAEGIERKEELDILVEMGVDLFQGYYLAMPE